MVIRSRRSDQEIILPVVPERWKDIRGWPGCQVSNYGRIQKHGRFLKVQTNQHGYRRVGLYNGRTRYYSVARLVAQAFLKDSKRLMDHKFQVDHIDGDKGNNFVGNLQIVEQSVNMTRAYLNGAPKQHGRVPVLQYKGDAMIGYYKTIAEASRSTGVNTKSIRDCLAGRLHSAGGYRWIKAPKIERIVNVR